MSTGAGLFVSLVIALVSAFALYAYALDLRFSDFKVYRRSKGGTWRHPDRIPERYPELTMSAEWKRAQRRG